MKRYVIFTFISIFIVSFSIYLLCENKIVDKLNPTPCFAPLTQFSLDESVPTDDNEPQIEGYSSTVESFSNGYIENVYILSHRIFIPDKEEYSREVIQMIIDNSLNGIKFSYDINGHPNGLYITVYLNESSCRNGNSSFKISYTQDIQNGFRYNIKDDPEKFVLEIIEE